MNKLNVSLFLTILLTIQYIEAKRSLFTRITDAIRTHQNWEGTTDDCDSVNGNHFLTGDIEDDLTVNGPCLAKNAHGNFAIIVNGALMEGSEDFNCQSLTVNGSVKNLNRASFFELIVNGTFNGQNIQVTNHAKVTGTSTFLNSKLETLELKKGTSTLTNSTAKKITVARVKKTNKPFITLSGKDTIVDLVIFTGDYGTVYLRDGAQVKKVVNGKIKNDETVN